MAARYLPAARPAPIFGKVAAARAPVRLLGMRDASLSPNGHCGMQPPIDLTIDVSSAAGLEIAAHTTVTIHLPDAGRLAIPPVVCFAFPGGGYCRRYYSFDMPNGTGGGQAGFHCDRGWIFVACDHLGFGDSTIPEGNSLTLEGAAAANDATVRAVMERLEDGTLLDGMRPVTGATKLGIGQSMGGCFTLIAQGRHGTFDGIAILGYSAIHTVVPVGRAVRPPCGRGYLGTARSTIQSP